MMVLNKSRVMAIWLFTLNVIIITAFASTHHQGALVVILWLVSMVMLGISALIVGFVVKERAERAHYEQSQYARMTKIPFSVAYASRKAQLDYRFVSSVLAMRAAQCEILSHLRFDNLYAVDEIIDVDHIVIDKAGCYIVKTLDDANQSKMDFKQAMDLVKKQQMIVSSHTKISFKTMIITRHHKVENACGLTPEAFANRLRFHVSTLTDQQLQQYYDRIEEASSPVSSKESIAHQHTQQPA